MTHKVHPKIFRIKETSDWDSRWLSKKDFSKTLEEDFQIRQFLKKRLLRPGRDPARFLQRWSVLPLGYTMGRNTFQSP